jgi:hypothetical protein
MKTVLRLIFTLLLVLGWGFAVASLHVVRTPDSFTILPKDRLGFFHSYVDIRGWTLEDVQKNPVVTARLLEVGKLELLSHVTQSRNGDDLHNQVVRAIEIGLTEAAHQQGNDWKAKLPDIRF